LASRPSSIRDSRALLPARLPRAFCPDTNQREESVKFDLGQIVATPGALRALMEAGQTPLEFVARHAAGDWGVLDDDDRQENERSLEDGCRLLSAYTLRDGTRIWIITEADRSATTLLLPEEY
jgi:hypothetical protein